jgi:tyrosyl-tRNA synthetase
MSKSLGNYVGIAEPPDEMFGKLMSIPDTLIVKYLRLCTDLGSEELDGIERGLVDGSAHPGDEKRRLARTIVDLYHGHGAGEAAEARFDRVFRERELPDEIPEVALPEQAFVDGKTILPRLLVAVGLASSNSDGRRKVEGGAVRLDQEQKSDPWQEYAREDLVGAVLQVGNRRFVRLARAPG